MPAPTTLDRFIRLPDVRERFEKTIRAPADVVMEVATRFDMQSVPLVRAVFWLRERLMGSAPAAPRMPRGLLEETQSLGWTLLAAEPGRLVVCGAACQPWLADVKFSGVPPEDFATYAVPDQVKIAWTLEADEIGPATTRFAQETRVVATDAQARIKFRRYWRWARIGIVGIRLILLPVIRRTAERQWQARQSSH